MTARSSCQWNTRIGKSATSPECPQPGAPSRCSGADDARRLPREPRGHLAAGVSDFESRRGMPCRPRRRHLQPSGMRSNCSCPRPQASPVQPSWPGFPSPPPNLAVSVQISGLALVSGHASGGLWKGIGNHAGHSRHTWGTQPHLSGIKGQFGARPAILTFPAVPCRPNCPPRVRRVAARFGRLRQHLRDQQSMRCPAAPAIRGQRCPYRR